MRKLFFFFLLTPLTLFAQLDDECRISLKELSHTEGQPGSQLVLYGTWGPSQGRKIPVINRGGMNTLEVLSWSPTVIETRIPHDLPPGDYKVGVYCKALKGATRSSGFRSFTILSGFSKTVDSQKAKKAPSQEPPVSSPTSSTNGSSALEDFLNKFGISDFHFEDYWYYLFLLLLIPMFRAKEIAPPSLKDYQTPQQQSPQQQFTGWKDTVAGNPFTVEQYSEEYITVEIDLPPSLNFRAEIDTQTSTSVPKQIEEEAIQIFALGAVYLDVNHNTNRIAAEFPLENGALTRTEAKRIASSLVAMKKKIS